MCPESGEAPDARLAAERLRVAAGMVLELWDLNALAPHPAADIGDVFEVLRDRLEVWDAVWWTTNG